LLVHFILASPSAPAFQNGHQIFSKEGRRKVREATKGHQAHRYPYPKRLHCSLLG
jgi:hypothetical protein